MIFVFRFSTIYNVKCAYCIPSTLPFDPIAAILFDDNFNEEEFDETYATIFDIGFIKNGYKKLKHASVKARKPFIDAHCTCKHYYFNGI
jgi:hypothetical protein